MLARWLDYRGEESQQALLWGYLNARFQTGLRNLLDGAILQTGGAVGAAGMAMLWQHEQLASKALRRPVQSKFPAPCTIREAVQPSCTAGREQGVGGEVEQFCCVDELPFDFVRRRLSVVLQARQLRV